MYKLLDIVIGTLCFLWPIVAISRFVSDQKIIALLKNAKRFDSIAYRNRMILADIIQFSLLIDLSISFAVVLSQPSGTILRTIAEIAIPIIIIGGGIVGIVYQKMTIKSLEKDK